VGQTLTLFKTEIADFATLFKTEQIFQEPFNPKNDTLS